MFNRFVDLSVNLENNPYSDPPALLPKITYTDHHESFDQMATFFPGLLKHDLPNGEAWAIEQVNLSTHNGTHLDAPYHFASTMENGKKAATIDEVPLDWCFRPGVKLDFRWMDDGQIVNSKDIQIELARIGYALKPLDIVLINTRAGNLFGTRDYLSAGCGMGREATLFLLEQGIRVTGTDAWSWDALLFILLKNMLKTKIPPLFGKGIRPG